MYALHINTRVMYVSESFVEAYPNVLRNEETFLANTRFFVLVYMSPLLLLFLSYQKIETTIA